MSKPKVKIIRLGKNRYMCHIFGVVLGGYPYWMQYLSVAGIGDTVADAMEQAATRMTQAKQGVYDYYR